MNERVSDQELVKAALIHREEFAALVARYDVRILRYVTRLGSLDPDTAKDVLQETFIKAYLHLNDYDPSLPFSAWIYRIAHNETVTHFRRQKNRPRPVENEDDLKVFDEIADDLDIEHESNTTINRAAVRAALDALDFKYRDVLLLRFFEEKSYDEISDILELPRGTVAVYLNRAKAKLKEQLKRYDEHT
ncbi:MAG: RNA polymerase sigma factor [Patescibacteria group bacterium]|nr:RNA polymerase sigma factor [Patescibacteria group bacterium]MDE1945141.1 RNA polymerase sigma factor [Patescibacteria group bacterium]MDE2057676.1 RNA polymerase sigma factor [Patescibacteria group bacterium]